MALRLAACIFGLMGILADAALATMASLPDTSYVIYDGDGAPLPKDDLLQRADTADVILIGEVHSDPASKQFAEALARGLSTSDRDLAISLEMFEQDVQHVLDEYLAGQISEEHFLADSRPWPGYQEHYRELVDLARNEGWSVIAANPPRRYVNRVAREGANALEELSAHVQRWLPPLPYAGPSSAYRDDWLRIMQESAHGDYGGDDSPHDPNQFEDMLQAQALWDAGMAHAIARYLSRAPFDRVIHLSGSFHVEGGTGITEQLARYRSDATVLTVLVRPVEDPRVFDDSAMRNRADVIVLSDRSAIQ